MKFASLLLAGLALVAVGYAAVANHNSESGEGHKARNEAIGSHEAERHHQTLSEEYARHHSTSYENNHHQTGSHESGSRQTGSHESGSHQTGSHESGRHETGSHESESNESNNGHHTSHESDENHGRHHQSHNSLCTTVIKALVENGVVKLYQVEEVLEVYARDCDHPLTHDAQHALLNLVEARQTCSAGFSHVFRN